MMNARALPVLSTVVVDQEVFGKSEEKLNVYMEIGQTFGTVHNNSMK